jgi:hypothetical protein
MDTRKKAASKRTKSDTIVIKPVIGKLPKCRTGIRAGEKSGDDRCQKCGNGGP